ncbi:HugZ family pyridoxamine 5'-phosphate oxidase [Shimia sp. MMG029]|uniref:HugZ family pyridoxamine 5'-phosphate oxidase n=1 Tax=Shimia sp. MMG029 TaxID=3021978 RepID=UPI0022FE488D|nr:pyridoxamine 5'-phosphate oxidase family protein [Shimia sp. MMG029]MDA5558231.1 pyridoxamine 5'-phosphate oxidase family protein [Shimia sp. MMG029]
MKKDPFLPADDDARAFAQAMIRDATYASMAVIDPETGAPSATRVALATTPAFEPLTLISDLASHTTALRADPRCSLLLVEPREKGDPLTHPRLTIQARAEFVTRGSEDHTALRAHYLDQRPKAKIYADFGDFNFVRLIPLKGFLNGGFAKAYTLTQADMTPATNPA